MHGQQPEKDKQNFNVIPWKYFYGRAWMHSFRSNSWVIKRGPTWFILLVTKKRQMAK